MGSPRRKRVLVCLAVLLCVLAICSRGTRTFASSLASKITHLRGARSLPHGGPIPYILDFSKHKPAPEKGAPTSAQPDRKAAKKPVKRRAVPTDPRGTN